MGAARPLGFTRVGIANAWEARPLLPNGRAVGCFVEIHDFEQFSWTQVQDFSKNEQFFERSRCVFAIFHVCSILERILARSRCIFRISLMKYRGFFNFS